MRDYQSEDTKYGFIFGPMHVERVVADERFGYVIYVATAHESLYVSCTPKGRKIRVERIPKEKA